ncbi:hypothetical protein ASG52_24425 [Methylobacterium sp. Leaf456]|uniref:hypothetical protein n=1 Tax=Methylobacterium sp. Leaf456 TaxID=1736382 RepID=UPI0006F7C71F|nr:hypothetical protein [Methylobacterium sp. Leaf456]KQT56144.1 hypothetical protein ASG52_24425 [Methylobacterium sp. Leaf456]
MPCPRAVEALTKQHDRLGELLRLIDNGRWWTGNDACRMDEAEVGLQADRIGAALDVVGRLAAEMAAENGTGTGSQLASKARDAVVVPNRHAPESVAILVDVGPFSPGRVGPLHEEVYESGGYEQPVLGWFDGSPKMA